MLPQGVCSINGCGKTIFNLRGWCSAHYQRWRKRGDPLAGSPMRTRVGDPAKFYRDVVLAYEGDNCLTWPFGTNGKGGATIFVDGHNRLVSRLICKEVHGDPPTLAHEAAHSCGMGHLACVAKTHLSWKTPAGNQADKIAHGTTNRGERQGRSKLKEYEVRKIRELRGIVSQTEVAKEYGIARAHVASIQTGRSWGWLV